MHKETEEQKKKRGNAIQEGYKKATSVPLKTAKTCEKILDLAKVVAKKGNQSSITDSAVSAIMAKAAVESAILNVKINLSSIKDEGFVSKINSELEKLQKIYDEKEKEIFRIVSEKI